MLQKLIEKGTRDRAVGDCLVTFSKNDESPNKEGSEKSNLETIRVVHENKKAEYDFHIVEVTFDRERNLPIRYASYLWPETPNAAPVLEKNMNTRKFKSTLD